MLTAGLGGLLLFAPAPVAAEPPASPTAEESEDAEKAGPDAVLPEESEGPGAAGADVDEAPPSRAAPPALEEIVVRAEHRDRAEQDTPAAISAFRFDEIDQRGWENVNDLQYAVPSLISGGGLPQITLRGVGSELVGPAFDPGFAMHINGVYNARLYTALVDFFDLESLQVLRGPQGILFGRSTTGGTFHVRTRRPHFDYEAYGDIEYGNYGRQRYRAVLNAPIVEERLAVRMAGIREFGDGQYEQLYQDVEDADNIGFRASLLFTPTPQLEINFAGTYVESRGHGEDSKHLGPFPTGRDKSTYPLPNYEGALPNPDDPRRGTETERQSWPAKAHTASLTIDYEAPWEIPWLGPFSVQSITGYQDTDVFVHRDQDASNLDLQTLDLWDENVQWSEEIQIRSAGAGPLEWVVGGMFYRERTPKTRATVQNLQASELSVDPDPNEVIFLDPGDDFGAPLDPQPNSPVVGDLHVHVENKVFGAFAHVAYGLTDRLRLSGGYRYSYTEREKKDRSYLFTYSYLGLENPPGATILTPFAIEIGAPLWSTDSWKSPSYQVALDYHLTDDTMLWARYSYGERAGGLQYFGEAGFPEEKIKAWEAGSKSRFFEDRLQVNLATFWYDYEDLQIIARVNEIPVTSNAPRSKVYGFDLELQAAPIENLYLTGTFGYLYARYSSRFLSQDVTLGPGADPIDLDGLRMNRAPRISYSLAAEYTLDLGDWGTLTPRVDYYFRDEVSMRQYGNPVDVQDDYHRTDLRLRYETFNQRYSLELYVKNLEDNEVFGNLEVKDDVERHLYYEPPRLYGVRFGFRFD
jgi:iron complex outermembrane receptor protein